MKNNSAVMLFITKHKRGLAFLLAAVLLFTTYQAMIRPALTLDEDRAAEDPAVFLETAEEVSEESVRPEAVEEEPVLTEPEAAVEEETAEEFPEEEPAEAEAVIEESEEETADLEPVTEEAEQEEDAAEAELPEVSEEAAEEAEEDEADDGMVFLTEETEEAAGEEELLVEAEPEMPAQHFEMVSHGLTVSVDAPEGAFPANTRMEVIPVMSQNLIDAISGAVEGEVKSVTAVDITFYSPDGNEIEPMREINVSLRHAVVETADKVDIVHLDNQKNAEIVEQSDAAVETDEVTFTAGQFSIYAIVETELYSEITLPGSSDTYIVTVTAPAEARIPEGSSLRVSPFAEGSEEYNYARNAVLADKKAKGEAVNMDFFNLAALDISILNRNGEEIEPEAPVSVSIRIKELPGVNNLNEVKDTLEIQHHVEVPDGVVLEKVFDGSAEGSFRMDPSDAVAERGTAVDPTSVRDSDFVERRELPISTNTVVFSEQDVSDAEMGITAAFETPVFSTFTITWEGAAPSNTTTALRWRDGNSTRVYVTVHYVDQDGQAITRPSGIGNTVDTTISNSGTYNYALSELAKAISGYTFDAAYRDSAFTKEITSIAASRSYHNNYGGWWSSVVDFRNGNTSVENTDLGYNNTNAGDIYLVYNGPAQSDPHTTIHYGYMNGTTFVEFEQQPAPVAVQTSHHAYLIYDFEGYQYAATASETYGGRTYYRTSETINGANMPTGATQIRESLAHNNSNGWRYRATNSNNWSSIADGSHIYVVYSKNPATPTGGTPKTKPVHPDERPDAPSILKESAPNGDGTTNLSLSVRGSTVDMEVEKLADVIVVFDVSGSMAYRMGGQSAQFGDYRIDAAKKAVNALADTLAKKVNSDGDPLIRMGLITFSTSADSVFPLTSLTKGTAGSGLADFKAKVNGVKTGGGTNWEKALKLADETAVDPERATFIIFVTDGDPTFRISRMNVSDAQLQGDLNSWDNSDTYYWSDHVFGTGSSDNALDGTAHGRNYRAALSVAESIVGNRKNFYTIGISNDVTNLNSFADDAGAAGHYTANSSAELEQAFDDIATSIQAMMGWGEINMTDGITDLSNTVMEKSGLLGVDNDFTYWKAPAPANWDSMTAEQKAAYKPADSAFVEWNPASERCAAASYNESTDAVEWHMGPNFVLQDGCTYKVTFSVWPSQEAYDWIADLKNGTRTWADVEAAGLDYPDGENPQIVDNGDGSYSLATNRPGANTTYKSATKSGDTVSVTGNAMTLDFNTVKPMGLAEEQIIIRKRFAHAINAVSPLTRIRFTLLEDGAPYKNADGSNYTFVLPTVDGAQPSELDKWQGDAYIAPGLLKTTSAAPGYQLLEPGHDYSLTETILEGESFEYAFTPQIVRPMVIGTTLTFLVQKDTYHTNPDGLKEYMIDGNAYYALGEDDHALTGTNRKTSELDITKRIVDNTGSFTDAQLDAETFTYRVTLTVAADADVSGLTAYEYVPRTGEGRFTIFGYQNSDDASMRGMDTDVSRFNGKTFGSYTVTTPGGGNTLAHVFVTDGDTKTATIDITLKRNEIIRFTNLPLGTEYTITEVYANMRQADPSRNEDAVPSTQVAGNLAEQGYRVSILTKNGRPSVSGSTVSGTIDELDKRYYNQFTNTLDNAIDVELTGTKRLDGYTWSGNGERYYFNLAGAAGAPMPGVNGRVRFYLQPAVDEIGTSVEKTYSFGRIRFTKAGTYTYTITEDNAGTIQDVNGTLVEFGAAETLTIVIAENNGELSVESVCNASGNTVWDAETRVANTAITNKAATTEVLLRKVDEKGELLGGSRFTLFKMGAGGIWESLTADLEPGDTEATNPVSMGGLATGRYRLQETAAPNGYILLARDVYFEVYNDQGLKARLTDDAGNPAETAEYAGMELVDGVYVVSVTNLPGQALPNTGGMGTTLFHVLGTILFLGAGVVLVAKKRAID
ncbi:MAG: VWA domain-containing protein [Oscillospiraceae bacterium]|nr:VWA domain-containing protein [Oscillospiraceae bacterium]